MDRWEQMQNFLIRLAKLTKADPQTMLQNDRQVYHELVRNGLTDSQKQFYVGDYFDQWINEFKNRLHNYYTQFFLLVKGIKNF